MTPRRLKLFVFLGAVLLFAQEPLVGKLLLPSSGGSFHVWATCLMFFQGALFLGYLYCHLIAGRIGRWHLLLVALPLAFLPIGKWLEDVNPDPTRPEIQILLGLLTSIGIPFCVLATTGVLAQRWLAESDLPERDNPYHLFAASNGGSLLALLGYPLLIEPFLGLEAQRKTWSVVYLLYLALAFVVAPKRKTASEATATAPSEGPASPTPAGDADPQPAGESADAPLNDAALNDAALNGAALNDAALNDAALNDAALNGAAGPDDAPPGWGTWVAWTLLAAAPSACLMAVTNVIAIDLGSAPLVWVIPLSLYLLTFILIFGPRSWYPKIVRRYWLEAVVLGLLLWFVDRKEFDWAEGLVHLAVLFVVCLVGHGELYRARPKPKHLTGFYLTVALGGWLGGVFVSLVAPHVFYGLAEYPLSILLLAGTLAVFRREAFATFLRKENRALLSASVVLLIGAMGIAALEIYTLSRSSMIVKRNVYGIYRVQDLVTEKVALDPRQPGNVKSYPVRWLTHGRTVHGKELRMERGWGIPIGFFHANSPLGRVVKSVLKSRSRPCDVAIVGLGAGALAGHLRPDDTLVYYELDPLVETLAREHFHYLETSPGTISVVHGDARLNLRSRKEARYDLILVDAFSSDAIPTHLLTREALKLYLNRLKPGGLLAFHISNNFYDLRPVLKATAASLKPPLHGGYRDKSQGGRFAPLEDPTTCYVLARDPAVLEPLWKLGFSPDSEGDLPTVSPWTDDYANILTALWAGIQQRRQGQKAR